MIQLTQPTPEIVEAKAYYQQIQAFRDAPTLDAFERKNEFVSNNGSSPNPGFRTLYFNNGDLQIGREMHCNQQGGHAACYVSNYGPQPFPVGTLDNNTTYPNSAQALTELEAIASSGHAAGTPLPFAAVAMESLPPAPAPATVAVNEWDGVTANLGPPKNCLANYSGKPRRRYWAGHRNRRHRPLLGGWIALDRLLLYRK